MTEKRAPQPHCGVVRPRQVPELAGLPVIFISG